MTTFNITSNDQVITSFTKEPLPCNVEEYKGREGEFRGLDGNTWITSAGRAHYDLTDKKALELLIEGEHISRRGEGREQSLTDFGHSWMIRHGDEEQYYAHEHIERFMAFYEITDIKEKDYDVLWEYFAQFDEE